MGIRADIDSNDGFFIGDDRTLLWTVYTDEGLSDPADITGWTFQWLLKESGASGTLILTKATGTGIAIVNAGAGQLTVQVDAADTAALKPDTYFQVLRRMDAGHVSVLAQGTVVVQAA